VSLTAKVFIALAAGLALGLLVSASGSPALLQATSVLEVVGTLWVSAIRMTVVPLVVGLLIVGVASASDVRAIGTTGVRAFASFFGLLALSAVFALVVVPGLFTWLHIDPATAASLRASAQAGAAATEAEVRGTPGFTAWLLGVVPTNPVKSAVDGAMLPLVVFTLAFAVALTRVTPERREAVVRVFRGISETMLVVVRWVIALAPIGVFALIVPVTAKAGASTAGALGYYVVAMALACFGLTLLLYPVAAIVGRVPIPRFARASFPAQAVAFSSSSSLASLPALVDGAERKLGLPQTVTGFALPLAVSVFKIASPTVWSVAAIFLAAFYGVEITFTQRLMIVATAGLTSFSVPGVPHSWLLLLAPLLVSVGVPAAGVALLFAVDVIPDVFATTLNVTADMTAATIIGRPRPSR
jgi:Na+/H+-dicarboxylate symporter